MLGVVLGPGALRGLFKEALIPPWDRTFPTPSHVGGVGVQHKCAPSIRPLSSGHTVPLSCENQLLSRSIHEPRDADHIPQPQLHVASLCGLASTQHGGGPQREHLGRTGQQLSSPTQEATQCQLCTDISQLCSTGGSRDPTSNGSCGDTLVRRAHRARLVV